MAHIRRRKSGSWEITIRRAQLPQPIHASADTEAQAMAWAERTEALIDAGLTPQEYLIPAAKSVWTVARWLDEYAETASPSASDRPLLPIVARAVGGLDIARIRQADLLAWVGTMKAGRLTPGSIRKRVGALGRALDIAVHRELIQINPVRGLPRNYAAYARTDGAPVMDAARDRRLEPGEEARLRSVLADDPDWLRLFVLALETAMRLSELYTLTVEQIDTDRRTIFLDRTKNGDKRQVPLSSVALAALADRPAGGWLFPFFDGDRKRTTARLSHAWAAYARAAACPDLHFHDLRHEATCRLFERTTLSDTSISLITGHRDPRMLRRYANLRGSDLAAQLW